MASGRRDTAKAKRGWRNKIMAAAALMLVPTLLFGCAYGDPNSQYPDLRRPGQTTPAYGEPASVFGEGGLSLGNASAPTQDQGGGAGVGSDLDPQVVDGQVPIGGGAHGVLPGGGRDNQV